MVHDGKQGVVGSHSQLPEATDREVAPLQRKSKRKFHDWLRGQESMQCYFPSVKTFHPVFIWTSWGTCSPLGAIIMIVKWPWRLQQWPGMWPEQFSWMGSFVPPLPPLPYTRTEPPTHHQYSRQLLQPPLSPPVGLLVHRAQPSNPQHADSSRFCPLCPQEATACSTCKQSVCSGSYCYYCIIIIIITIIILLSYLDWPHSKPQVGCVTIMWWIQILLSAFILDVTWDATECRRYIIADWMPVQSRLLAWCGRGHSWGNSVGHLAWGPNWTAHAQELCFWICWWHSHMPVVLTSHLDKNKQLYQRYLTPDCTILIFIPVMLGVGSVPAFGTDPCRIWVCATYMQELFGQVLGTGSHHWAWRVQLHLGFEQEGQLHWISGTGRGSHSVLWSWVLFDSEEILLDTAVHVGGQTNWEEVCVLSCLYS